jgi:hypothetical protein
VEGIVVPKFCVARRWALATVALLALVGSGALVGSVSASALDPSPPPVVGEVHFGNATITQSCDDTGYVTSTRLSVDYDARQLQTYLGVYTSWWGPNGGEAPGPRIGTVSPGTQGSLTRTISWHPPAGGGSMDGFAVFVRDGLGRVNQSVLFISALHSCSGAPTSVTHELDGPVATVSGPDCTGAVTVDIDNSASDLPWTPAVSYSGSPSRNLQPVVAAHRHGVLHLDAGNARSFLFGLEFRTTRPDTHWTEEYTDGGTYGLSLPEDGSCDPTARGAIAPLPPTRLVDTRSGTGAPMSPVGPGGRIVVQAGGRAGIPADADAVVVNLTVAAPQRTGHLQAWSATDGPGTGSVLNFVGGRTQSNTAIVPLDIHGRFSVRNVSAGSVHLLADVTGYVLGGPDGAGPGDLVAQDAVQLYDTRATGSRVPVPAGATVHVPVAGHLGVAANARTVAARVTATGATRSGHLTVWPGTGAAPATSTLNFGPGRTTGVLTTVPIAADGTIAITNHSSGPTHLIVESQGWWRPGTGSTGSVVDEPARRLLDTRADGPAVPARGTRTVDILGAQGTVTHLHGVAAAIVTVTVVNPTAGGFLTARSPGGTGAPATSDLSFSAGVTTSNVLIAPVDDDGNISIYNGSGAPAQVAVDITGYVTR